MSLSGTIVCTPKGNRLELFLKSKRGSVKKEDIVKYVKTLKHQLKGRKLLLIWDGLSAHRAKIVAAFLKTQKDWLRVERFPAYAPELNPVEYLWSSTKSKHLCNLRPEGMPALKKAVGRTYRRVKNDKQVLRGFLKASELYD